MKATCLVLVGWLAMMSLGLMACQGLASLPTATSPAGPTLVYSPASTLSPTVPIPVPVPTPSIPPTIPAQPCLLSNLPAKGEKLLQQANVLAWSPDSHSLVFLGPGEMDDSLLGTLTLVEAPGFETPHHLASNVVGDPAWSPDGSRIAFVAFRSDDELGTAMTVNADGSGLHDLFPGETARTDPGMGYKAVGGWLDEQRILIMTNCGTGCSRPLQLDLKDGLLTPVFRPGGEGAGYAWSPDRNYVVVTAGFNPQIGIASGTGGEITWLSGHHAHDPAWARFWTLFADWAPDGSHFLFLRQPDDASEPPTLWVWNVEAGSGSPLLPGVVAATWSPEGDTIAFLSLGQPHLGSDGTWQDVVAMPEGPNTLGVGLYRWPEKQIIAFMLAGEVSLGYRWPDQLGQLLKPAWAPNGNFLVYRDGAGIAWILSADDLARCELDTEGASVSTLSWSPDGKKLAVSTSENLMVFAVPGTGVGLPPLPTQTTEPPSPTPSPTLTYTPSPQPTTSVPPSPTLTPSPPPTLTHTPSSSPSAALPTATAISDRAAISPGPNITMGSSWHHILFTYNHAGATELWTIDPTNGTANQQIRPNEVIHDPAMSPSGDVIAYIRIPDSIDPQSSTTPELWLMDKDGSNPRPLYIPRANHGVYHPVWLHNGQEIYFQQYLSGGLDTLLRISATGGEPVVVLSDCLDFALSPDGECLLSMNLDRGLFLSNQDGEDVKELVPQAVTFSDYGLLTFSPDGSRLAFRGTERGKDIWNLYLMYLADLGVRRLTDLSAFHPFTSSSGQVMGLAWTSDGTRLVYSVDGHPEQRGIWVVDTEGGERRRIFTFDEWAKVQRPWFE